MITASRQATSVDETSLDKALSSSFADFEDSLQYHAALSNGIGSIITRNINDHRNTTIPVMTAGDFLAQFSSQHRLTLNPPHCNTV